MQTFELYLQSEKRFIEQIIARYFRGELRHDVLQELSIHLFFIYNQNFESKAHLFDSRAWLRTVVVNFCISQLRKEQAQKNSVWSQSTTSINLKADEHASINEDQMQLLYNAALGFVSKKEALILKMKYEYKCTSKEIERRLKIQYVDVLIARIKARIRKKMGRIDLEY